uniref:Uncharacterized protein n=1 Tax=Anguilla anguilla TaxID=7936 RepID=A0A0E9PET5_ANGAN
MRCEPGLQLLPCAVFLIISSMLISPHTSLSIWVTITQLSVAQGKTGWNSPLVQLLTRSLQTE